MNTKHCSVCGAAWFSDQHYWSTGKVGNELDLAGLVCNTLSSKKFQECANPRKGEGGGQTWAKRFEELEELMNDHLKDNGM